MKWLKHMAASWDDEKLAALVGKGGMEGLARYGLYWRVNEIIASQMDGKTPSCSVRYPVTRWSLLLSLRGSLVFSTLSTLAVNHLAIVERDGSDIIVTNCNLLKYRDEYSRKSGHTPAQEVEEEGDIKPQKDISTTKDKPSLHSQAETLYASYPRHIGKRVALKSIEKALKEKTYDELATAIAAYWKKIDIEGTDNQFIPHPATWFNQGRYDDDMTPHPPHNGNRGDSKPPQVGIDTPERRERQDAYNKQQEAEAYAMWKSMPEEYRSQHPWEKEGA